MVSDKMRRKWCLWLWSVVLVMQVTMYDKSGVDAGVSRASSYKGPKIDLKDPFYDGQIHYDDALTETPIGTIVYAIDDDINDDDTSFIDSNKKNYQLQDVVTHSGNINNKSFINQNIFAIGSDGNDANIDDDDIDNDEDDGDEIVDLVDNDGVIDKQAISNHRQVFNSFIDRYDGDFSGKIGDNLMRAQQNQLNGKQQHQSTTTSTQSPPVIANERNQKLQKQQLHDNVKLDQRQGQSLFATTNNNNATEPHLPNGQMTHKHLKDKTISTARMNSHQHHHHHNHRKAHNNSKWYRRHQKLMKLRKNKSHHSRHQNGVSRSGSKSQRIRTSPKSSLRSGSSSYVQAHVNFYDSNSFDDTLKSNRFSSSNYRSSDKWPHLTRLQNQLHQDMLGDKLPPYIKKYNRRNKQLLSLLEGQGMPNVDTVDTQPRKQLHSHRRRQKDRNKWIEKNLFEEQQQEHKQKNASTTASVKMPINPKPPPSAMVLSSKTRFLTEKNVQSEPNALPGEHLTISSEEYSDCEDEACTLLAQQQQKKQNRKQSINQKPILSPKADSFLFHRVATPKLVGTSAIGGGLIKQRLPFVALTDKRIGENSVIRQQRVDTMQNTFPLP